MWCLTHQEPLFEFPILVDHEWPFKLNRNKTLPYLSNAMKVTPSFEQVQIRESAKAHIHRTNKHESGSVNTTLPASSQEKLTAEEFLGSATFL